MNQDQQSQPWWKDKRFVWASIALAGLVIITILGHWQNWAWIELLWRWLELLIIPIVLAAGAFWFNTQSRTRELEQELARRKSEQELALQARESEQELAQRERENDREIAKDRAQEQALQRYLDRMQELILDKGLKISEKDAEIRDVARARTLAVLRSLDDNRKGQVARFLYEAQLITGKLVIEESGERQVIEAIIDLGYADLSGADLIFADLRRANLLGANLEGANLHIANLSHANLSRTNLQFANLSGANLSHANLRGTNLSHANLSGADLSGAMLFIANLHVANLSSIGLRGAFLVRANLSGADLIHANLRSALLANADLSGSNLSDADLSDANLTHVDLSGARNWTNEQLAQPKSLVGAILPNGKAIETEDSWEEFKKLYRHPSQAEEVPKQ